MKTEKYGNKLNFLPLDRCTILFCYILSQKKWNDLVILFIIICLLIKTIIVIWWYISLISSISIYVDLWNLENCKKESYFFIIDVFSKIPSLSFFHINYFHIFARKKSKTEYKRIFIIKNRKYIITNIL